MDDRVVEQVSEGDVVFTRVRVTGTQLGPWLGTPPSGRRADFTALGIDRFRGDRVIERTALFDVTDVMRQLGHESLPILPSARQSVTVTDLDTRHQGEPTRGAKHLRCERLRAPPVSETAPVPEDPPRP